MGWKPADVYACTVPEFWACFEGWRKANTVEANEPEPMTKGELRKLIAEHGLERKWPKKSNDC